MSRFEKLLSKMRNNPLGWKIDEIETIANYYGLTATRPGGGSSHVTFRHSSGKKLTIPAHKPIKPIYIKLFLILIEEIAL